MLCSYKSWPSQKAYNANKYPGNAIKTFFQYSIDPIKAPLKIRTAGLFNTRSLKVATNESRLPRTNTKAGTKKKWIKLQGKRFTLRASRPSVCRTVENTDTRAPANIPLRSDPSIPWSPRYYDSFFNVTTPPRSPPIDLSITSNTNDYKFYARLK